MSREDWLAEELDEFEDDDMTSYWDDLDEDSTEAVSAKADKSVLKAERHRAKILRQRREAND